MINLAHLPNQERGEQVVLFLRRYWIDLAVSFLFAIALVAVPIVLSIVFGLAGMNPFESPFWGPATTALVSAYLLVAVVLTITQVTDYFLDMWIVTNERIINIEQHGLFRRKVSEMRLNQVQDISSETHGFLETFLTYGDVTIQTAGEKLQFHFKNIDNPDEVKLEIAKLVADCKKRHGDASGPTPAEKMEHEDTV